MKEYLYEPIPTDENIEYVFQRILVSLILSKGYIPYQKHHQQFKDTLNIIMSWIEIYSNTKNLTHIDQNLYQKTEDLLSEIDQKYILENQWYAQQSYEWFLQLGILIKKMK